MRRRLTVLPVFAACLLLAPAVLSPPSFAGDLQTYSVWRHFTVH